MNESTSNHLAGIEIGGTKLQLVLGNERAVISKRWRFEVDRREGGAGIRRQIEQILKQLKNDLDAIGVGFGGPVDWRTGQICCSHQIEGWNDFPLGEWLRSVTKKRVAVDNDANVAALGEALHGAGRGFDPVFYVTLGSGVGGGAVVNGAIYHGTKPGESEIGHVRLDKQGMLIESRCSGWAVDARVRAAVKDEPEGILARLSAATSGGEARWLNEAMKQGDVKARRILNDTADDLAFGLSHVVHLFHPAVIVLGGGLSMTGETLRSRVAAALDRYVMKAFTPRPIVALADLREDAVPVGALELARRIRSPVS